MLDRSPPGGHVPAPWDLAVTTWNRVPVAVARHFNGTAMPGSKMEPDNLAGTPVPLEGGGACGHRLRLLRPGPAGACGAVERVTGVYAFRPGGTKGRFTPAPA
jgi:hypothetical protein